MALLACLLRASLALGQDVAPSSLKAVFTFNFAQFTTWPDDVLPMGARLTTCVIGDDDVFEALERTVMGRTIGNHAIVALQPTDAGLSHCHLLYVSGVPSTRVAAILAAVRGQAVLTVSDLDLFTEQGGIARLFVERGKMRFNLNYGVAKHERLQLSSKLLALAARVFNSSVPTPSDDVRK